MKLSYTRLTKMAGMALALAMMLTIAATSAHAGGGPPPPDAPEIDPASMGSALTLLLAGAAMITGRSRKS